MRSMVKKIIIAEPITAAIIWIILKIYLDCFHNKKDPYKKYKDTKDEFYFDKLTLSEIKTYVNSLEPLGCAGGFYLEGRGGYFISRIDGCYSNVMGLSLPWLRRSIKDYLT